jgi:hypothetical protein
VKNYEGFNCIPRNVLMGGESAVKTYYWFINLFYMNKQIPKQSLVA